LRETQRLDGLDGGSLDFLESNLGH